MRKSGALGLVSATIGIALLLFTFYLAYETFFASGGLVATGIEDTIIVLLSAAVKALFLGIMAWIGSIFLVRGVEYFKVDRGVGMVTFKVEKGIAHISEAVKKEEAKKE